MFALWTTSCLGDEAAEVDLNQEKPGLPPDDSWVFTATPNTFVFREVAAHFFVVSPVPCKRWEQALLLLGMLTSPRSMPKKVTVQADRAI